jgi:hypothetical protein
MTGRDTAPQRSWTPLGRRLGITTTAAQREQLLAAIERMSWNENTASPAWRCGPARRAVVAAIFNGRLDHLRQVGEIALGRGRQLIGLRDSHGTCSYVLEQDTPGADSWLSEAVFVLVEYPSSRQRAWVA